MSRHTEYIERMKKELWSDLMLQVEAGDLNSEEAMTWYNEKCDKWSNSQDPETLTSETTEINLLAYLEDMLEETIQQRVKKASVKDSYTKAIVDASVYVAGILNKEFEKLDQKISSQNFSSEDGELYDKVIAKSDIDGGWRYVIMRLTGVRELLI